MTYDKLLAKSRRNGREITLFEHTKHVIDAAQALFGIASGPSRLGRCWLRLFKLDQDTWPVFHANLLASCALHDWGKANDGFQDEVRGKRDSQAIRHEHLSALLIGLPQVTQWLKDGGLQVPLVLSAVLTHHLKASGKIDGFATAVSGTTIRLVDYGSGFQEVLQLTAKTLGFGKLDATKFPVSWTVGKPPTDIRQHRARLQDEVLEPFRRAVASEISLQRLLGAVRAALITADAVGSGVVRNKMSVKAWIDKNVTRRPLITGRKVWKKIINKRVDEMRNAGKWHDLGDGNGGWNQFQIACDDLPDRALLIAPCGSGKTLAAWRWIAKRLDKRPGGYALFLYPTRATAREGFKDYVSWAPEADAALMHGTSGFDLAGMFTNVPVDDVRHLRDYEAERRMFALGYWSKRAFSATVDQFLAFMQYSYSAICMLPVLADAVIVIDEVHSFDRNMFASLKDFLTHFDVPVLCMTATLPIDRRGQLIRCGLAPPPAWPEDLSTLASLPRYRVHRVFDRLAAADRVRRALLDHKRVLWVVNQVKRAQSITRDFASAFDPTHPGTDLRTADGIPIVCYHSRFRLSDRVNRHSETIRALKDETGPALGVTTQVCEMSLDIDVDLLVTEECPVTSIVQRMGRCNRERNARPLDHSGEVLVYSPEDGCTRPYSNNDLKGLPEFLSAVAGRDLSQDTIESELLAAPSPEREGDPSSRFLTSGPYAVGANADDGDGFREADDYNRQCVLDHDLQAFNRANARSRPGFVLPVPNKFAKLRDLSKADHRKLPAYLGIAMDSHYHAAIGFCDHPLTEWSADR